MACKNCNHQLSDTHSFCNNCGAKVITERITLDQLFTELFSNAFGWDNKFIGTLKGLILDPAAVFKSYLNGTRKKYVNPFAFFAIGVAIIILVFNIFSDDYIKLTTELTKTQTVNVEKITPKTNTNNNEKPVTIDFNQKQIQENIRIQKQTLKYFNIYSFILLPMYTFIGFLVYRKPYNYGEHLIVNAYIQGITFLLTILFFILSITISSHLYYIGMIFMIFYYSYAYTKLYKHSFKKSILKLLKFLGLIIGATLIFVLIAIIVGFTTK